MFGSRACLFFAWVVATAAFIAPAASLAPCITSGTLYRLPARSSRRHHRASSYSSAVGRRRRGGPDVVVIGVASSSSSAAAALHDECEEGDTHSVVERRGPSSSIGENRVSPRGNDVVAVRRAFVASFLLLLSVVVVAVGVLPSPCLASSISTIIAPRGGGGGGMPRPSDLRIALISVVDGLSRSGKWGMATYAFGFTLWTMTVGVTTPIETAAGMAFPLRTAMLLSTIGKVGGAVLQYALAKYLFSDYARRKMDGNEWMDKIDASFRSRPYGVALIWRFSPLPEFVKNVGPALVPGLKTRYQVLAILTHGLPFTALWSCMGNEAAIVARGGPASVLLKRMVAAITWIGLFISPTLFGMWIRGLGESAGGSDATPPPDGPV